MELKEKDDVDQIWRKHRESTADNSYELAVTKRNLKKAIIQDLKGEIQEFVQSLDDAGKEDNKDLVNWFSKFETATTPEEVSQAFNEFQDLYEVEWDRENKAGETNCRLAAQVEYKKFMKQIMSMP